MQKFTDGHEMWFVSCKPDTNENYRKSVTQLIKPKDIRIVTINSQCKWALPLINVQKIYNNASSDNTQENGKYLHAQFAFAADLPEPFALTANKMKRMY